MDKEKEIIEQVAKVVASELVDKQAPNRRAEHQQITVGIIKFMLVLALFEISIFALITYYNYRANDERVACIHESLGELQYEHVSASDFVPTRRCR